MGRTSQAKNEGNKIGQGRWPKKSCEFLLGLLKNAESNAEVGRCLGILEALAWRGDLCACMGDGWKGGRHCLG